MLREKKYENVDKAFSGALTTQTESMRDNVFMPLLWKFHFLVMWYEKLTNQFTIYNSVEGFDPDLLSAVQKKLVKLFPTCCLSEPLLKTDRLVFQSDISSCGACVCYAIDAVAAGILKRYIRPFTVNESRMWVVYALWQNSATCNFQLKKLLQKQKSSNVGLSHFSNDCWFSATPQAVQCLILRGDNTQRKAEYSQSSVDGILWSLVHNITLKHNVVKTTFLKVCSTLGLDPTEQQDASEFYMRYSFHDVLIRNRLTPCFQVETQMQCHECGETTKVLSVVQTVFILPIFHHLSGGSYLSDHFYRQLKQFAVPDRCICHATRFKHQKSKFVRVPEILSVIIWRTADSQKNTKVVVPDRSLTVETATGTTVYRLVAVVVHCVNTMTREYYVCYAFGEKGVTEYNDKIVQSVPYENVSEKLSTGGYLFFYKKIEASQKTDTENDQVSKQETDHSAERVITVRRKKRKGLPEINTSVCFALEEVPLSYSGNGQPSRVIDFADLNDVDRTRLQNVREKLIQCLNKPISKAQSLMEGYCHCLFLRERSCFSIITT